MNLLVTGGAGFIGSNFIELVLKSKRDCTSKVVNLDALTYAGNIENTEDFLDDEKYVFENVHLCDIESVTDVFNKHDITHVVHLAAESHVDNSILDPTAFIESNIVGTFNLLKAARSANVSRFHHVSTDEVYGDLGDTGMFKESTPYNPRNPYSASKAASDFLVRSYFHTYKFPATISNCSNNYGPRQHNEKFIPVVINALLDGKKIPLYGVGNNVRDWIYVQDHCEGLWNVLVNGTLGETYCIGSSCEKRNIDVVKSICTSLGLDTLEHIEYVEDRVGHDYRYAIDPSKIKKNLGWTSKFEFHQGIETTIKWYNDRR